MDFDVETEQVKVFFLLKMINKYKTLPILILKIKRISFIH
jgi:hypothetical protein